MINSWFPSYIFKNSKLKKKPKVKSTWLEGCNYDNYCDSTSSQKKTQG